MSCITRIYSNLYDTVFRPPLVVFVRFNPTVTYKRSIRTAVDVDMHRILLCRIKILRINDHTRKGKSVFDRYVHKPPKCILGRIIVGTGGISYHPALETGLAGTKLLHYRSTHIAMSHIPIVTFGNDSSASIFKDSHTSRCGDIGI